MDPNASVGTNLMNHKLWSKLSIRTLETLSPKPVVGQTMDPRLIELIELFALISNYKLWFRLSTPTMARNLKDEKTELQATN